LAEDRLLYCGAISRDRYDIIRAVLLGLPARNPLDEVHHRAPQTRIVDIGEGANQSQSLLIANELDGRLRLVRLGPRSFKKGMDRHIKRGSDLHKPACAHAVCTVLVLLDLLKGQTEKVGQVGLRHLSFQPPETDVVSNDHICLLRRLLSHIHSCQALRVDNQVELSARSE